MTTNPAIAVLGTFDTKAEEHIFLKEHIERKGLHALTINVGTHEPSTVKIDLDLFNVIKKDDNTAAQDRDNAINAMLTLAKTEIRRLYHAGIINAVISAGGGTGTHICTSIMRELPLGVPKVMVSTVASRNMSDVVATKDITMIHSVADLLGVNSISGKILDCAAAAVCGMVTSNWHPLEEKKRIALPFFGFITKGAEATRHALEALGYEVIAFHANGTGGTAMEELAADGYFDGILDLATHELADHLLNGYCGDIGPERFEPIPGKTIPRLIVPGGLDCAVLEFTRQDIPDEYKNRKIFFYDFRSAIRLDEKETTYLAKQLAQKLSRPGSDNKILVPMRGWSEPDRSNGPLYDPDMNNLFLNTLRDNLTLQIEIQEVDHHINDAEFGEIAAAMMDRMIKTDSAED